MSPAVPADDPYGKLSPVAIAAHDAQRAMPEPARRELIDHIAALVADRQPCLDAGIGTGNVAIPLVQAGIHVVGVDVSISMVRAMSDRLPANIAIPTVMASLTDLPFADESFRSVHCAHTLHLVEDWKRAIAEVLRVTQPCSPLLFALGAGGPLPPRIADATRVFWERIEPHLADVPSIGPRDEAEVIAELIAHGATQQPAVEIRYDMTTTIAYELDRLEHNVFARPASLDRSVIAGAADHARATTDALDTTFARSRTLTYLVFER